MEPGKAERAYKKMVGLAHKNSDLLDEPVTASSLADLATIAIVGFQKAGFGWGTGVNRKAVEASLSHLVGRRVDFAQLLYALKRLSRNRESLIPGRGDYASGCGPWKGHLPPNEWTCLRFVDMIEREKVITFKLEVDWGPAAPEPVYKVVRAGHDSIYTLMYKAGLGRKHSGNPRELVGLRIWGECIHRDGLVSFARYAVDPQLEGHNKKLIAERRRPCQINSRYNWLCCECPVGLNMCNRATRPRPVPTEGVPETLKEYDDAIASDAGPGERGSEPGLGRADFVDESGQRHCPLVPGPFEEGAPGD